MVAVFAVFLLAVFAVVYYTANNTEIKNEIPYLFISRCTCPKGEKYAYDGRKSGGIKSPYYIPSVSEVLNPAFLAELAEKNRERIHGAAVSEAEKIRIQDQIKLVGAYSHG